MLGAMAVATPFYEKTDEQKAIIEMVRQFVDEQIIPKAEHYDGADEYPEPIVEQMKELGLFGVTIPEEYGGMGLDLSTYTMIVEELSRGWISISGVVNTHFIGSYLLMKFGTDAQKERLLPRMATGEIRAAFCSRSPSSAPTSRRSRRAPRRRPTATTSSTARRCGSRTGSCPALVFVLVKTDREAGPPYKGMTCFICEKEPGASENPGLTVPPKIKKMGYKGVESTELVFDGYRCPADMVLGGEEAGPRQGLRADDGRARGRPRQRRRARRRHRPARARARPALRPGAQDVRQADRRAPGDPVQARRHGDEGRGRPPADA